ncbi:MAG: hypothetical protein H7A27_09025 [Spirochaetaceae bacterium]|nr:hypothetical protein [Spirochaetaceae bacterium]
MAKKTNEALERERMAESIAMKLPADSGGYSLSAATAGPLRRALRGVWAVAFHEVGGEPFVDRVAARSLKGAALADIAYRALYDFKDSFCVKRVDIDGTAELPGGGVPYGFRQRLTLSWDLEGAERLRVRPEMGYQCTSLDGAPAAVKELEPGSDDQLILFRFEGDELVLEEGDDVKRLRRLV